MNTPLEDVESLALLLPREGRARLAERLIASLDDDSEVEQTWASEIHRRVEELRTGAVQEIPAEQVFDELKSLYR